MKGRVDVTDDLGRRRRDAAGAPRSRSRSRTLRAELQQEHDRHLRTRADFENYRRRVERDRDVAARQAKRELLKALVDLADGFDRALVHIDDSPDSVAEGLDGMQRRAEQPAGSRGGEGVRERRPAASTRRATRPWPPFETATARRVPWSTRPAAATCGTTSSSAPPGCGSRNRRTSAGMASRFRDYYEVLGVSRTRQRGRDQEGLSAARPQAPPGRQPGRQDGRRTLQGAERGQRRPVRPGEARTLRPAGRELEGGDGLHAAAGLAGGTSGGQGWRRAERSATSSRGSSAAAAARRASAWPATTSRSRSG